jgi:subtilase family serine protease
MTTFPGSTSVLQRTQLAVLAGLAALTFITAPAGLAQRSRYIPDAVTRHGVNLGRELPSEPVSASVWLPMHNKAEFDAAVEAMYTPGSPTFHKWMTNEDMKRFQPTEAEVAAVKAELEAHHLTVVSVGAGNSSVKFSGTTENFESAFHTQLNRYSVGEKIIRVASSDPMLTGRAAGLVRNVTGFSGATMEPHLAFPHDARTGKQIGIKPLASVAKPNGDYFSSYCLYGPQQINLTSPGTAAYLGYTYGANPSNTTLGTLSPCGYSPEDLWTIYNLRTAYAKGISGQKQTLVIVDAYGSPTIQADLTTFNSQYGLPTPSFTQYTPNPVTGSNSGWAEETTLDVEYSHAISPSASIALVATPSPSFDDLQTGVMYAINNNLGNTISNSYGGAESEASSADLDEWETICQTAVAKGISVQFSTGDSGDFAAAIGHTDVATPADSPHATAVGGTSVAFAGGTNLFTTGWGTNLTELSPSNSTVDSPPVQLGFQFGAGGGVSSFFAKPTYQNALSGSGRHLPDVSEIADPYTGVEIIITVDGGQYVEVIGGTSLASPVFSAMWSLFNEYYGTPQGQAAIFVASGSPYVIDVAPIVTGSNTIGRIIENGVTTNYTAAQLAQPLENTTVFTSAIFNAGEGTYYNLTFGTDSSLVVAKGWDNVTGYGTLTFTALGN